MGTGFRISRQSFPIRVGQEKCAAVFRPDARGQDDLGLLGAVCGPQAAAPAVFSPRAVACGAVLPRTFALRLSVGFCALGSRQREQREGRDGCARCALPRARVSAESPVCETTSLRGGFWDGLYRDGLCGEISLLRRAPKESAKATAPEGKAPPVRCRNRRPSPLALATVESHPSETPSRVIRVFGGPSAAWVGVLGTDAPIRRKRLCLTGLSASRLWLGARVRRTLTEPLAKGKRPQSACRIGAATHVLAHTPIPLIVPLVAPLGPLA